MNIETLMTLLPSQRNLVHLKPRRRGHYRDRNRIKMTEDELVNILINKKNKTTGDLRRLRDQDKSLPTVHDFITIFGRWKLAVEKAYGKQILDRPPPNDPNYIAQCSIQFNIWTQASYLKARRLNPGVIPSARQVRRVWGGFSNLFFAARKQSIEKTFGDYLRLERRMGRIPTALECRQEGLDLNPLREIMGSKFDIDGLLSYRNRAEQIAKAS